MYIETEYIKLFRKKSNKDLTNADFISVAFRNVP